MAKVKLQINGQEVEVEKGTTILEAAKEVGVYIPTLCYHPFLPLEEACRICVVEDVRGGWSTLVAACVFPVRNGMVIETDSEKVLESRRTILDLLLSDHPNDCMTCQATGECELQDLAFKYNVKITSYSGERHDKPVDSDPNPFLHIDMNKCVLCRRCIRACREVEGAEIWTKKGRGFEQQISTAFDLPLADAGCEFCGHCADFCPVDAIGWREGRKEVRPWMVKKTSTVCMQCPSGCRADYEVLRDKVVRVRGNFESPANVGALCKLGRFNLDPVNSPERIKAAALRDGGRELSASSIEEALKTASVALAQVRDSAGGSAIGVLCGGMLTNEEYYLAQKLARAGLASGNVDNVAGPWETAAYEGVSGSLGFDVMTNPLADIAKAGAVLVMGSNTLEKHAIAAIRARKAGREGGILIVAHPENVPLTKTAGLHLALKPGSEASLVLGLMKVIVDEELYDKEYVENHTKDFEKLVKGLKGVNLGEIAAQTGLSEDAIREAAKLYASKRPACLVYGIDPSSSPLNEGFYQGCADLQLLLGSVGVEGGGVNIMGCSGNAMGAAMFGALPKYLPGYRGVGEAAASKAVAKLWKADAPGKPGLSWPEMFEAIEKGKMKALYLIGVNPFELGMPKAKVEAALGRLQLLVVQDSLKNPAVDYAHVVLPGSSFLEKDGTAINCERRIQCLSRAMKGPGDATPDFDLINGLLGNLNPALKTSGVDSAFAEAAQLVKDLAGVAAGQIPVEGIQLPVSKEGSGTDRIAVPENEKGKFKFMTAIFKEMPK